MLTAVPSTQLFVKRSQQPSTYSIVGRVIIRQIVDSIFILLWYCFPDGNLFSAIDINDSSVNRDCGSV